MSIKVSEIIEQLPGFVVPIDIREIVHCSDPEFAERRQYWIDTVYGLQEKAKAEVEKITANNIETLDAKREALVIKLKAARAAFDEMNSQSSFFQSSERQLSREVNDASFAVRLKRGSPLTPAYATKADVAQWQSELDALVEAENAAIKRYYSHTNLQSMWASDCQRLKAVHDNLAVEEAELRHRLERLRGLVTGPQKTSIGLSA